ncbi:hypothetical protein [Staphylococcus haemolyticus]|uniref:hypothetical protein n=1 Tax=Staphylococcus haemolyticus TaxID=1283 RepID=UPI001F0AC5CB|nr:hypothetical protein [Staphylococcus haemolyticus]MCH4503503.1 hypothetical protein [Staphylococcus haemolyticus]MCH4510616.1 hypothetical protein [Staphylococcus haemolyticus]MCH4530635.1 hypothetical protein [Staphylococcus haemolyticus]
MQYSVDEFKYNELPKELSDFIIEKENILNGIKHRYAKEVGKVFYEAQQEFSDFNNGGLFEKWYTSIGFKKRNVYNYIQIYNEVQQLHGDQLETFEELPKRLQLEISKPSHIPELKEKVLDGDIKTHKEYKELERKLKQRDEQNAQLQSQVEQAQRSEEIAKKQLEDAESREPEVIEKYMEPEDYQETKNALAQSRHQQKLIEQRNEKLEKDIKDMEQRRDEISEKSQKYDELNKAINDMNAKLNDGQQRLKAQKEIYDLVKGSEKVIREVAPLCYLAFSKDIIDNDYARKPIEKIIDDLTDMSNRLRKQLKKGDVIDV